ncbi:ATP-dependent DNA helicase PIF1-like [Mastacembelus armatus]|uniref:ATP-dependent DNA helicase PIF1-like n=1 Tax=Mastacembelus armatus TaxID=205130 RepID=UPI000E45BCEE|nr:ATP-dependent DNA helicase PIF1-like [Mastacembelus armatus]
MQLLSTLHLTLAKIFVSPYIPLGDEKLNSLRAKYMDLQILIIDEISMVHHKLLAYIHGRLRQIKQSGDFSPFGNISVIAVGDFYQLPPVHGKALYVENLGVNFWTHIFKVAELTTIMRQKDNTFAELLNRLRTRCKGTPMLETDIKQLKQCETGEDSSELHIFPTNQQVFAHNLEQLKSICPDYIEIQAQDFGFDKKTGKLKELEGHLGKTKHTNLLESLPIGINARVMLCKNVDVADGLVNGVCGTVTHIEHPEGKRLPVAVYVKFDDSKVGTQRRKRTHTPADLTGSTRIEPEEELANKRGEKRRQFPLKLAWACTVHKVQGITVDKAVVSLKKVFAAGQAYVALSRVRGLEGLVIQGFKEKAIYCNDSIKIAMQNMPPFMVESLSLHKDDKHVLTVFFLNVQGLARHVSDLASCVQHLQPNCIAVAETWLNTESSIQTIQIEHFRFHSRPRNLSYQSSTHPALILLQSQQHGGVGMYCDENVRYEVTVPDFNLECLVYSVVKHKILVAVVYRPPSYPMSLFKYNLERLLNWLNLHSETVAVMGDFNDDILKSSSVCNMMIEKGYVQYVTSPTTERGTLIDHIYVKSTQFDTDCVVIPTYFSDHEGILCSFKLNDH